MQRKKKSKGREGGREKTERVRQDKRKRVAHRGRWMDLFTIEQEGKEEGVVSIK